MQQPYNKDVIVDFEGNEDCGVIRIDNTKVLLQSVDFITPVVDDPYIFGKIAASNALSDIFAMGGEAISALNLVMWDKEHISQEVLKEILRGGLEKIIESNASLLGGHTIVDREQKYGLSVSGIATTIWRNNTANIGDVIILCKPIGSGVITTALKQGIIKMHQAKDCLDSMQKLNLQASRIAKKYPITACTDITGFGLIGHLYEMCNADTSLVLDASKITFFDKAKDLVEKNCISGGSRRNQEYFEKYVDGVVSKENVLLYDAQTSGGIVFALDRVNALSLLDALKKSGYESASIIGEFVPNSKNKIILK